MAQNRSCKWKWMMHSLHFFEKSLCLIYLNKLNTVYTFRNFYVQQWPQSPNHSRNMDYLCDICPPLAWIIRSVLYMISLCQSDYIVLILAEPAWPAKWLWWQEGLQLPIHVVCVNSVFGTLLNDSRNWWCRCLSCVRYLREMFLCL
jgi:hypothetical protein